MKKVIKKLPLPVVIPFYFFVDRDEEGIERDDYMKFLAWMNLVTGERNPNFSSSPTRFNGNHRYTGFKNMSDESVELFGAFRSDYKSKFINYGAKLVTLEFWETHIKEKTYKAASIIDGHSYLNGHGFNDDNAQLLEIKELYRYQVVRTHLSDPAIEEGFANLPLYEEGIGRMLDIKFTRTNSMCQNSFVMSEHDEIDGYVYPLFMIEDRVAAGQIFKCDVTGNYSSIDYLAEAINEAGELVHMSRNYTSYTVSDALDLKFTNQSAAESYGLAYCHVACDWVSPENVQQVPNSTYHSLSRGWKCKKSTKFTVGFEVEKEDEDAMMDIPYKPLYDKTGWVKESDSSLSDEAGYELVSPVYDLLSNKLDKDVEEDKDLQTLIEADHNDNCGGHINIGSSVFSPIQLLYGLKGFLPLMYSIWDTRVESTYSEARKVHRYANSAGSNDHSSAIQVKRHVLEIRIASAVRSVKNMFWRRDLVRIMVLNINKSEQQVLRMLLNPRSILHQHLRKVYKDDDKFMKKCNDFVKFADEFNDIQLGSIDWNKYSGKK